MLYKFHRVNDYLFKLITNSSFWFANSHDFNDPFDMRFASNLSFDENVNEVLVENELSSVDFSKLDINKEQLRSHLLSELEGFDPKTLLNYFVHQGFQNMGMCCFSKAFDNILLWSHYTEGHKGVCIEFDQEKLERIEKTVLIEMDYSDDFPTAKEGIELRTAFRKSRCWEYEKEYRIIYPTKASVPFPKESIKRIIFGARTETEEIHKICDLIKNNGYENVSFVKADIHPFQYKLTYSQNF